MPVCTLILYSLIPIPNPFPLPIQVFRYLPLATTVNDQVLVAHGGLFSAPHVTLADLQQAST